MNMGITSKKELGTVSIEIAKAVSSEEEEELPNTARQL